MELFKRHRKELENLGLCVAVVGYFAYVSRELKRSNELAIAEAEGVLCQVDTSKRKLVAACTRNAQLEKERHEQIQHRQEQEQQRQEQEQKQGQEQKRQEPRQKEQPQIQEQYQQRQEQSQEQQRKERRLEQQRQVELHQNKEGRREQQGQAQLSRPVPSVVPANAKCNCDFALVIKTAKAIDAAIARCGREGVRGEAILERNHGPLLSKVKLLRQQRNTLVHNLKCSQLNNRANFEALTAEVLSAIRAVATDVRNRDRRSQPQLGNLTMEVLTGFSTILSLAGALTAMTGSSALAIFARIFNNVDFARRLYCDASRTVA
jgi:flagellar biosynthesis GTPase FlhF